MYSNGIRKPVQVSLSRSEYTAILDAGVKRNRSLTAMITAVVKSATADFTKFNIADTMIDDDLIVERGDQTYKKVHIQCNLDQRNLVKHEASVRTRSMSSLIRAIVHNSTSGLTDFSIVDRLPN